MVTVLIAAGGTGGHIFPALAVAAEIRKKEPKAKILFCGTKKDQQRTGEKVSYETIRLPAVGMPGKFSPQTIVFGCKIVASIVKSWLEIRRRKPDAVVGFGGYVSAGPVIAARMHGIPVFLHESNLVFGRANRFLKRCASSVMVNQRGEGPDFENCIEVGMPLREEFYNQADKIHSREKLNLERQPPLVVVAGGSQGAHQLNAALVNMAKRFREQLKQYQFLHLTGKNDYRWACKQYQGLGLKVSVRQFEPLMQHVMDAADLVVCRSGASTLAELSARATPAVLVPYPFATDGHQMKNARYMQQHGAAIVIDQAELDETYLFNTIIDLLRSPDKLKRMAANTRAIAKNDAASKIVDLIFSKLGRN